MSFKPLVFGKTKDIRAFQVMLRRGHSHEWERTNPILLENEVAVDLDLRVLKIGDGSTRWNDLLYAHPNEIYNLLVRSGDG